MLSNLSAAGPDEVRVKIKVHGRTMVHRQCQECGGELVLARRSDGQGVGFSSRPSNYWRCSICGGEFTAEQVRENKRSKQLEVARRLDQPLVTRQGGDGSSSRMGD